MPQLKNKPIRIETFNTNAWQVRFYYQNEEGKTKYHSKLFSDAVHGGKEEAYQAAIEYRNENLEDFIKDYRDSEIEPYRRRDKRNNSGVPGIIFYEFDGEDGTFDHVRAHVSMPNGKVRTRTLSMRKHGTEKAVKEVCQFRYEGLQNLHGEENPYPSWKRLYNEIVATVGDTLDLSPIE